MTALPDGDWNVISLDVFDTLLVRKTLTPKSIDLFLARDGFNAAQIFWRRNTEHLLRISNGILRQSRETSLDELSRFVAHDLLECECNAEEQVLELSEAGIKLLKEAQVKASTVILISDTIHPAKWIHQLLENLGLANIPDIYVSSELKATKRDGGIFCKLQESNGWAFESWLHIGDDLTADVKSPSTLGITTFPVVNPTLRLEGTLHKSHLGELANDKHLSSKIILGILAHEFARVPRRNSTYFDFGFSVMGPLAVGFSEWLISNAEDAKDIYFLGRDGFIPKKCCEILDSAFSDSSYLRVSRRLLLIPAWLGIRKDPQELVRRIPRLHQESVNGYLSRLKLPIDKSELGIAESDEDLILSLNRTEVLEIATQELVALQGKLKSFASSVRIVDVGWRATLQEALEIITQQNVDGMYLGTISTTFLQEPKADAWLINTGKPRIFNKVLKQSIGLIERSFSELIESSFTNLSTELAHIVDPEIAEIQRGITEFASRWASISKQMGVSMERSSAIAGLSAIMLDPRRQDIELIGSISNSHHPQSSQASLERLVPCVNSLELRNLAFAPTCSDVDANWNLGYERKLVFHFKSKDHKLLGPQLFIWRVRSQFKRISKYGIGNAISVFLRIVKRP